LYPICPSSKTRKKTKRHKLITRRLNFYSLESL